MAIQKQILRGLLLLLIVLLPFSLAGCGGGGGGSDSGGGGSAFPKPTVTLLSPNQGTVNGGTSVTITGSGFSVGDDGVKFGGVDALSVTVVSDTTITAVAPPGSGVVNIEVTTAGGASVVSAADQFTFTGNGPPPPPFGSL